ncbi:MAG TPA: hypothetical protein DCY88_26945 [Cyanobacteria bacterium UBA11372]|nr:hypothetical protein [Cyanobacteria bacterium UBA11372]HBE51746.1 hypothetical protein [Cyanobacteria bacterium UBA11369]
MRDSIYAASREVAAKNQPKKYTGASLDIFCYLCIASASTSNREWSWRLWLAVPLYPYSRRRTRQEFLRRSLVSQSTIFQRNFGVCGAIAQVRSCAWALLYQSR